MVHYWNNTEMCRSKVKCNPLCSCGISSRRNSGRNSVGQTGGRYEHKYDYPAIFRIDRIEDYEHMDERFSLPYASRFQEGEFRKRVQFMYPCRLEKIRFRYTGKSVDAILDRLPTAKILSQEDRIFEIEAEVYGKGIVMWLLSQGERVEVIAPAHLREKMRDTLLNMLELYR